MKWSDWGGTLDLRVQGGLLERMTLKGKKEGPRAYLIENRVENPGPHHRHHHHHHHFNYAPKNG